MTKYCTIYLNEMPACMSAYVCVAFNQVKVALQKCCDSLFHILFNHLYSIHNYLLCNDVHLYNVLLSKQL